MPSEGRKITPAMERANQRRVAIKHAWEAAEPVSAIAEDQEISTATIYKRVREMKLDERKAEDVELAAAKRHMNAAYGEHLKGASIEQIAKKLRTKPRIVRAAIMLMQQEKKAKG